jgi:hypothetical protein
MNGYQKHKRLVRTILKQAGIHPLWIDFNRHGWLDVGFQGDQSSETIEQDIVKALQPHSLLAEYPVTAHSGRETWRPCLHITMIVTLDSE